MTDGAAFVYSQLQTLAVRGFPELCTSHEPNCTSNPAGVFFFFFLFYTLPRVNFGQLWTTVEGSHAVNYRRWRSGILHIRRSHENHVVQATQQEAFSFFLFLHSTNKSVLDDGRAKPRSQLQTLAIWGPTDIRRLQESCTITQATQAEDPFLFTFLHTTYQHVDLPEGEPGPVWATLCDVPRWRYEINTVQDPEAQCPCWRERVSTSLRE